MIAHAGGNTAKEIVGFPVMIIDTDNESLQFNMEAMKFPTDDDSEHMGKFVIYADGDKSISLL